MANTKKVRVLSPVGNPASGAILARGAVVDLGEYWADRYAKQGLVELVEKKADKPKDSKKDK